LAYWPKRIIKEDLKEEEIIRRNGLSGLFTFYRVHWPVSQKELVPLFFVLNWVKTFWIKVRTLFFASLPMAWVEGQGTPRVYSRVPNLPYSKGHFGVRGCNFPKLIETFPYLRSILGLLNREED